MDYKKTILKTILYTMLVMIGLFVVFITLMFFVFTRNLADFMYGLGSNKVASTLYYRVYEKTDDIIYCHKALNIKINMNDNEKIIKYYEEFIANDEYENFMVASKEQSENLNISVLEKSAILNEDNYLSNSYVKALIGEGEVDKAWGFALNKLYSCADLDLDSQGVYVLSWFISQDNNDKFDDVYGEFDEILINEMQDYFDSVCGVFDLNKNTTDVLEKAYLVALGNRIINVGQDINVIYSSFQNYGDIITSNIEKMVEVNNIIKGII